MAERTGPDRLAEFVHVLRGLGVPEATIGDVHDVSGSTDLVEALGETLDGTDERALYDSLHETIARSNRGIECPRDHDVDAATAALSGALETYDCTLSVTDDGDAFEVAATDGAGDRRSTTVSLPARLPDDDPLPVLAHAVEELLSGTDLTVVVLTERDDVWRLALVPERRLTDLQERLGLRLTVFGRPLLCADQPGAFAKGVATAFATATDGGTAAVAAAGVGSGAVAETESPSAEDPAATDESAEAAAGEDPAAESDDADEEATPDYIDLRGADPESIDHLGGGPTRVVGESVEDIVDTVTDRSAADDADDVAWTTDDSIVIGGRSADGPTDAPDRVVADDDVDGVLAEVGVLDEDTDDVDLDEALSSMAGEFDTAPSLPEPLASATDGDA